MNLLLHLSNNCPVYISAPNRSLQMFCLQYVCFFEIPKQLYALLYIRLLHPVSLSQIFFLYISSHIIQFPTLSDKTAWFPFQTDYQAPDFPSFALSQNVYDPAMQEFPFLSAKIHTPFSPSQKSLLQAQSIPAVSPLSFPVIVYFLL